MSALRQAMFLTAAFLSLMFIAGAIAVNKFEHELQKQIEDELTVRFAAVANDLERIGFDPARYPQTEMERIEFTPEANDIQSGFHNKLKLRWGFGGGAESHESKFRTVDGRGQWIYLVGPVAGGQLIVATNPGREDDFLEIMLQTMALVGIGAAIAALGLGSYLGLRTQRRISAISTTLENVGIGDLTARVSAPHRRDDLDDLSHQVDMTITQLDVLMRQSHHFAANIAHDLKTPLSRLRIRLDRALTAEANAGDRKEPIEAAIEQTEKIIAIFDAFMRIAKLESGAARAGFAPINLGQLAREIYDIYDAVVDESGRTLVLDISDAAIVQGDRVLLIQMLANLIENAIRHTPEGTQIRLIAKGTELGLADTGPGIPENEYERITQPLYRLEKSRTTEGVGLGLSLVKTIADLHKAELQISKNPELETDGLLIRAIFSDLKKSALS